MMVNVGIMVFWDMKQCSLVDSCQSLEESAGPIFRESVGHHIAESHNLTY